MRTAMYKGNRYRLDYLGNTRYGYRAKLGFFNGRKTFWVNGNLVKDIRGNRYPINPDVTHTPPTPDVPPPYEDEFDAHMAEVVAAGSSENEDDIPF